MTDRLKFSLVSPERELISAEVDSVVVPGSEGEFGVLPRHAPLMSTIMPGIVRVVTGTEEKRIFIKGGFADVTPAGLTILAEIAMPVEEMTPEVVATEREAAEAAFATAATPDARLAASRTLEVLAVL